MMPVTTPRCDEHTGDPFPARCVDCDALAVDATMPPAALPIAREVCQHHGWPAPCPRCPAATAPVVSITTMTADERARYWESQAATAAAELATARARIEQLTEGTRPEGTTP